VTVVVVITAAMLAVAAVLALIRLERGPTMLDRTIAVDVVTSVLVAGIATYSAWTQRSDTVPVLLALALVGFVTSVTISRFAAVEPEGEGRVLSREEADALEAARRAEEERELSFDEEHHGGPAEGEVGR
jgi:multicomponent Na+:H+ antiporter subunit F